MPEVNWLVFVTHSIILTLVLLYAWWDGPIKNPKSKPHENLLTIWIYFHGTLGVYLGIFVFSASLAESESFNSCLFFQLGLAVVSSAVHFFSAFLGAVFGLFTGIIFIDEETANGSKVQA